MYAAMNGHLAVLKWARTVANPRCPWNESTCAWAAKGRQLAILKWARTVPESDGGPCPWDRFTCAEAALNNDLDILKWARKVADPPCPWDSLTAQDALRMWPDVFGVVPAARAVDVAAYVRGGRFAEENGME